MFGLLILREFLIFLGTDLASYLGRLDLEEVKGLKGLGCLLKGFLFKTIFFGFCFKCLNFIKY